MNNTKESLGNFIQSIDDQIKELKRNRDNALIQIKSLENEERLKKFNQAIVDPINWAEVLRTNETGEVLKEQKAFLDEFVKPVNKIILFQDFFHTTLQMSIHLQLINSNHNKNQLDKLMPILNPLIGGLEPVPVHVDVPGLYKVIPLNDKHGGEKGTYSILLGEDGMASLYREYRIQPEFLKKDISLEDALKIAAKKYYFFG